MISIRFYHNDNPWVVNMRIFHFNSLLFRENTEKPFPNAIYFITNFNWNTKSNWIAQMPLIHVDFIAFFFFSIFKYPQINMILKCYCRRVFSANSAIFFCLKRILKEDLPSFIVFFCIPRIIFTINLKKKVQDNQMNFIWEILIDCYGISFW